MWHPTIQRSRVRTVADVARHRPARDRRARRIGRRSRSPATSGGTLTTGVGPGGAPTVAASAASQASWTAASPITASWTSSPPLMTWRRTVSPGIRSRRRRQERVVLGDEVDLARRLGRAGARSSASTGGGPARSRATSARRATAARTRRVAGAHPGRVYERAGVDRIRGRLARRGTTAPRLDMPRGARRTVRAPVTPSPTRPSERPCLASPTETRDPSVERTPATDARPGLERSPSGSKASRSATATSSPSPGSTSTSATASSSRCSGRPGSGKTTTLRMIAGFELPTAGRVLLHGADVTERPAVRS